MTDIITLSFDEITHWLKTQTSEFERLGVTHVIGVLKGGAFPALLCSYQCKTPLTFIRIDPKSGVVVHEGRLPMVPGPILLCDDLAGSDDQLQACYAYLKEFGYQVYVLTLAIDGLSAFEPDFAMDFSGALVRFPWDAVRHQPIERDLLGLPHA